MAMPSGPFPPKLPATATQQLLQPQYTMKAGVHVPAALTSRPAQTGQMAATLSTVGKGVPNSTTPGFTTAGSQWINTLGTTGARIYVSNGSGWTAIPGL
jgi:hypothetical protein